MNDQPDQLLDKWGVEILTSLDITTIYRRMKKGLFPQPVRVGRRRVAWRASDIRRWQQGLPVGVGIAEIYRHEPSRKRKTPWQDELRAALTEAAIDLTGVSDLEIVRVVKQYRREQKT